MQFVNHQMAQEKMCQRNLFKLNLFLLNLLLYPVPKAIISVHNSVNHDWVSV